MTTDRKKSLRELASDTFSWRLAGVLILVLSGVTLAWYVVYADRVHLVAGLAVMAAGHACLQKHDRQQERKILRRLGQWGVATHRDGGVA